MFVVVYLCDAKKHIIVRKEFILGLSQQALNNYGKNRNKKYLIYWSQKSDDDELLDPSGVPNFELNVNHSFPPDYDECCFYGQIKYFFESFQKAKEYRDKFRPIKPVAYNPSHLKKTSLQRTHSNEKQSRVQHTFTDDEQTHNESCTEGNASNQEANFNEHNELTMEDEGLSENAHNSDESDEEQIVNNSENDQHELFDTDTDEKEPLPDVQLNARETDVFNSVFDESEHEQSQCEESLIHSPGGTARMQQMIGDDCEMIFEIDREVFKPLDMGYQVKLNDLLSENIPFQENVKKDRAYMIHGGQEVNIAGSVVQCLISLNEKYREDKSKDKVFLKGLLIAVCSLTSIENLAENQLPPKQMISFIKNIFVIRIGDKDDENGARYLGFKKSVQCAINEIRRGNYK